ncbi:30S ribosomal protein S20 [bacterium]|nr:30S ribosomal protein S20 [bacterium]
MANTSSAKKYIKVNRRNRLRNIQNKTRMKNIVKKVRASILSPDIPVEDARKALKEAQLIIYKTAGRGIIHKNSASRKYSRLVKLFNRARIGDSVDEPSEADGPTGDTVEISPSVESSIEAEPGTSAPVTEMNESEVLPEVSEASDEPTDSAENA